MKQLNLGEGKLAKILLSGGVDSAACVRYYLMSGWKVVGLFINYGQSAWLEEKRAAKEVAKFYQIELETTNWSGKPKKSPGYIQGRNAFLLMAALLETSMDVNLLAIGIHSGTDYSDCSPDFVERLQAVFDLYCNGAIQIDAPFLSWTKSDVLKFCKEYDVPYHLTYSCELGTSPACGECQSCLDRRALSGSM